MGEQTTERGLRQRGAHPHRCGAVKPVAPLVRVRVRSLLQQRDLQLKETSMAESDWEQQAYGNHCMHGTAVGTPSGADFMCGWCEDGYTHWRDDPLFNLEWRIRVREGYSKNNEWTPWMEGKGKVLRGYGWRESSGFHAAWGVICDAAFTFHNDLPAIEYEWRVRQVDDGYWTDEAQSTYYGECTCTACE